MKRKFYSILFLILSFLLTTLNSKAQTSLGFDPVPPAEQNFSSEKLDSLGQFLDRSGSSALIILSDGKLVYSWGQPDQKLLVHSIRKALLNSLFGIYVSNGTIDTTMTLADLEIDDIEPALTTKEKSATIADLLKSRSGVYHHAAAVNEAMLRSKPGRGSHDPNEAYYYNNWDFNTLGAILEKLTGKSIFDLFDQHIAKPLKMDYGNKYITVKDPSEDWQIPDVDGFYQYEPEKSRYPAYHFRLTSNDLARYGQLYLNNGSWNGRQIIPEAWIEKSIKPYSITNEQYGIGYGMLWNVLYPTENRATTSFFHTGVGIHMLGVYPGTGMVLIHRVDTEIDYQYNEGDFYKMISMVFGAKME